MYSCWRTPPVVELTDEQGRHVAWENVPQEQQAA
jgi:hypothetical protein